MVKVRAVRFICYHKLVLISLQLKTDESCQMSAYVIRRPSEKARKLLAYPWPAATQRRRRTECLSHSHEHGLLRNVLVGRQKESSISCFHHLVTHLATTPFLPMTESLAIDNMRANIISVSTSFTCLMAVLLDSIRIT